MKDSRSASSQYGTCSGVSAMVALFETHGASQYGGEKVSQLEHALQAASLAEHEQAPAELIVAALLHDVGHLLHDLPDDSPSAAMDDHHENSGGNLLCKFFPVRVTEPIRLHVAAKRYLCAVEPDYEAQLSQASLVSLRLQGGRMTPQEVADFERQPFWADAVRLRRWDDAAKVPELATPPLAHFAVYAQQVALVEESP